MTAPTIPTDASELEEFLHDETRFGEIVSQLGAGNNEPLKDFIGKYATASMKKDVNLGRQVEEQVQKELRDFLIANGQDVTGKLDMRDVQRAKGGSGFGLTNRDKGQMYNVKAPGAKLDKAFASHAEFFQAAWHRNAGLPNVEDLRQKMANHEKIVRELRNAAGSTVPSDGGFLIPEILRSDILQLALEGSVVRPYATVIPMDSLTVPIPAVDETSRVNNIYGGIQFYWTPEGGAGVDSSAKFSQINLVAKKLFGYSGIPNELLADAAAFVAWFGQAFPSAYGWFEDIAFLNGNGGQEPQGVIGAAGAVTYTRAGSGQSQTIGYDDIVKMFSRMYPASMRNSRWVANISAFPQLAELSFTPAGGTTPVPVMLWQMNAVGTPVATLLGRPIEWTEKTPQLGTTGDLALVDFSQYLIGDRQAMSLESSNDYLFGTDKTAFRLLARIDGQPWLRTAITPHSNGPTLSPYVLLGQNT
jgi:HK97 family phage major capsid protein